MGEHRHHSDILIAGCILIGAIAWLGALVGDRIPSGFSPSALVIWFVASFVAAHVARCVLEDLDRGELAIATLVTLAIVQGVAAGRDGRSIDLETLAYIGVGEAGALASAFALRRPARRHAVWLVAAAGAGAFGALVLAVGLSLAIDTSKGVGYAVLLGAPAGGALVVCFVEDLRRWHAVLGQSIAFGGMMLVTSQAHASRGLAIALVSGLVWGALVGALSAWLGARLRRLLVRPARGDLPEARRVK